MQVIGFTDVLRCVCTVLKMCYSIDLFIERFTIPNEEKHCSCAATQLSTYTRIYNTDLFLSVIGTHIIIGLLYRSDVSIHTFYIH